MAKYYSQLIPVHQYPMYVNGKFQQYPEINGRGWNVFGNIMGQDYWCMMAICKDKSDAQVGDKVYNTDGDVGFFSTIEEVNKYTVILDFPNHDDFHLPREVYKSDIFIIASEGDYNYIHQTNLDFNIIPPARTKGDFLSFMEEMYLNNQMLGQVISQELLEAKYVEYLQNLMP